jgi:hypothetical protein
MECKIKNNDRCNCTYPCDNHAVCCDCVAYHRRSRELPACYFPANAEKTYDRSVEHYMRLVKEGKC